MHFDAQMFLDNVVDLGTYLEEAITSLVLASGTLLAMVSLRNGHIAERARENVTEIWNCYDRIQERDENKIDVERTCQRIKCLKRQNSIFMTRHAWTSITCAALTLSFMADLVAYVFLKDKDRLAGGILTFVSFLLIAFSAIRLIIEFMQSRKTLLINNEGIEDINHDYKVYHK